MARPNSTYKHSMCNLDSAYSTMQEAIRQHNFNQEANKSRSASQNGFKNSVDVGSKLYKMWWIWKTG